MSPFARVRQPRSRDRRVSTKSTGWDVFHQALDVADSAAVAAFVTAVETRFGRIDICVTNSGWPTV
jgi:NAD(P)-dependent dehydrogenase (short-subunit alcohol dehydrogenase family)